MGRLITATESGAFVEAVELGPIASGPLDGLSFAVKADIESEAGQRRVWTRAVMPLLEEYFYNWRDSDKVLSEFEIKKLLSDQG